MLKRKNPPFHERFKSLVKISVFCGMYHPALNKIVSSKSAQWAIWVFTRVNLLYLIAFPLLNLIHFLFFDQRLYEVIMNLMIMSSGLHNGARIAWFAMRQNQFGRLYDLWDDYFGADANAIEREARFQVHYQRFKKRIYYYSAMVFVSLNPWIISQYFESDKTMKVPTPIPYRRESPYFEGLVTFYVYPCAVHTFGTAAVHVLMEIPEMWVLSELERLKESLREILTVEEKKGQPESPDPERLATIDKQLGTWIDQHQKLKLFQQEAENLVWVPYSIEMLATFMAAWLTGFNFVQEAVGVEDKIVEVFFYMPYVLMFIETCSYCDRIKEESENIIDEAYVEHWSALPIKYRKSLIIIAQQATHPFIVKGFKIFPTGYFTFAQIMQSAYSMFNFLLAATNREG